eukprot:TRINITY_DN7891_c0_g2_i1.p2 TRINITY_DN7891_c0_g2~~TRINITY_DN7891_c0_g2_i1.p2  ORF type:complete len:574 (+),score=159.01 TRINITY_DN7891_c0_g2_i1:79-1800(+)
MRVLAVAALLAAACGEPCKHFTLGTGEPDYKICWTVEGDGDARKVALDLEVKSSGWVGFGISEPTGAHMAGSDIVIIEGESVTDRYAVGNGLPKEDKCGGGDWTAKSIQWSQGVLVAKLERLWAVPDKVHDRDFNEGIVQVVLAVGGSGLQYHASSRRAAAVEFVPQQYSAVAGTAHLAFGVPFDTATEQATEVTEYVDGFVDLVEQMPALASTPHDIVGITFVDDTVGKDARLHHVIMETCPTMPAGAEQLKAQMRRPAGIDFGGCSVIGLYAPGADTMRYPHGTAFRVKSDGASGWQNRYIRLEYHYDNPKRVHFTSSPIMNLTLTTALQAEELQIMGVGDRSVRAAGTAIPTGESTFQFDCRKECTNRWSGAVKVHSVALHMHQIGAHMRLLHLRGGDVLRTVLEAQYYTFGNQPFVMLPEPVEVLPGDELIATCRYNNPHAAAQKFGLASEEEMCIAFAMVTPRGRGVDSCGLTLLHQGNYYTGCGEEFVQTSTSQEFTKATRAMERTWGLADPSCPTAPPTPVPPTPATPVPVTAPPVTEAPFSGAAGPPPHGWGALLGAALVLMFGR